MSNVARKPIRKKKLKYEHLKHIPLSRGKCTDCKKLYICSHPVDIGVCDSCREHQPAAKTTTTTTPIQKNSTVPAVAAYNHDRTFTEQPLPSTSENLRRDDFQRNQSSSMPPAKNDSSSFAPPRFATPNSTNSNGVNAVNAVSAALVRMNEPPFSDKPPPPAVAAAPLPCHLDSNVVLHKVLHNGYYWSAGDIVSVSANGFIYYAQIRIFVENPFSEKYAALTWLVPTSESTSKNGFDPNAYMYGPEEGNRLYPLQELKFVMQAPPSDYYRRYINPPPANTVYDRSFVK